MSTWRATLWGPRGPEGVARRAVLGKLREGQRGDQGAYVGRRLAPHSAAAACVSGAALTFASGVFAAVRMTETLGLGQLTPKNEKELAGAAYP